jgi:undecaprenyl-diphosphatase
MSIIDAVLLGLVQGVAEFLPVSSDGHLALLGHMLRLDMTARLPFTVMLHAATALSMLVFFAPRILRLVRGLVTGEASTRRSSWDTMLHLGLGTLPAGIVGYWLGERIEELLSAPLWLGVGFLASGAILYGTRFASGSARLGWWRSMVVGVAQSVGIVPAVSRAGATISAGLYLGLGRSEAFEFSVLLAIPAIAGAFLHQLPSLGSARISSGPLAVGLAVAFVSGLAALWVLRRIVLQRRLYWFAFYCWAAGVAVLVFVR